ncbi:hypothetical protein NG819_12465 [Pseudarthrobacter sp. Fe7]|nr:hypothetical protein NG819_12465 [Pseudarthrobacter sp. Fe7]
MKENTGHAANTAQEHEGYVQDTRAGSPGDALSVIDEGRLRNLASQLGVPYVHRAADGPVAEMMQQARPGRAERTDQDGSVAAGTELYWILPQALFCWPCRRLWASSASWAVSGPHRPGKAWDERQCPEAPPAVMVRAAGAPDALLRRQVPQPGSPRRACCRRF